MKGVFRWNFNPSRDTTTWNKIINYTFASYKNACTIYNFLYITLQPVTIFYITGLAVKKVIFHSYRNATIKLEGICLEQLQFNFPLLDIKYCILIFWTKNCYHILLRIKYLNCFRIIITTNKIYYEDWILKDKKPKIVSGSFQTKNLRLREM